MNRDEKATVIEEVAGEIREADAVFAVDFRGISVKQSADLRGRLDEAGARFRVVKNRLTQRSADAADAATLKDHLNGPTALTFVRGDVALAAKALATFRRESGLLAFKGGTMNGDALSAEQIESISQLPAREVLYGQLVGVTASPITGLVRGLAALISGLAIQLEQIREQGLVGGGNPPADAGAGVPEGADAAAEAPGAAVPEGADAAAEAPGDPVAEAATAEAETSQAPSEGEEKEG